MMNQIYTDNAATTPISSTVLDAMLPYLTSGYGNPSSLYSTGRDAKAAIEDARRNVADAIGCESSEIIFTGGGSEADNLAIKGLLWGSALKKGKNHIITSKIEHHAILHTVAFMERMGCRVTYLDVDNLGRVDLEQLRSSITSETALVSIMAANNEIGTIQPLAEIARICHDGGTLFHCDAVQGIGHMELDVRKLGIDMLSMSAHKIRGPKGVGALYCRKGIYLEPLIHGGGQESRKRSGTENVAGIVGFGAAIQEAVSRMPEVLPRISTLRRRLEAGVAKLPYARLTGDPEHRLPGTASFAFECIEGESLILMLDMKGIAASTGSACSTGSLDPSHVLMAIGLPHKIAHGSLRITIGEQNTEEEIDYILASLEEIIGKLRYMSPVWDNDLQQPLEFH